VSDDAGTVAVDGTVSIPAFIRCGINDGFADVVSTNAAGKSIRAHVNVLC